MITFLNGILSGTGQTLTGTAYLVIDVHGVGYQVYTCDRTLRDCPPAETGLKIYTSLIVREDAMNLVGFLTRQERDMYDMLSSASGVGMKSGLSLLSGLTVSELAGAIMAGEHKRLTVAKGVGPKLAQKITIELKEKITGWREQRKDLLNVSYEAPLPKVQAFDEAEAVLLSLGYSIDEIQKGLSALIAAEAEAATTMTSETVLQFVLKWVATHS